MTLRGNREENFPFHLLTATSVQTDARTGLIERTGYEACTIEYVYNGSGFLEINGCSYTPEQDSVYILTPGSTHRYWPNREKPWAKIFFCVDGDFVSMLLQAYLLDRVYYIPNAAKLQKHFEAMNHLNYGQERINQAAAVIFHQLVEEASQIVYRKEHQIPQEIEALKNELDYHLEKPFVLEEYCQRHQVTSAHLIRSFREYYQDSPYNYLMKRRMEQAQRLLLYSNFSVKEIAERLCFSDQYYFSNYFKRQIGMSPSNYQKK